MDRFGAHLDRAWELIARGDTSGAWLATAMAQRIDDQSPEVHNLFGYVAALKGEFDDALDSYLFAFELDEFYLDPVLNAAEILAGPGENPSQSLILCDEARHIAMTPDEHTEVTLVAVEALLSLERTEEARAMLHQLDAPEVISDVYCSLIGRACFEVGEFPKAKQFIDRALASDPNNADAWYFSGLIAKEYGDKFDADRAFLATRSLDLGMPLPPWSGGAELAPEVIARCISGLDASERERLRDAEIVVQLYPSKQQVLSDVDPRQIVLAQGIDPVSRTFREIHIFTHNLKRSGIVPVHAEKALIELIREEIGAWSFPRPHAGNAKKTTI